MRLIAWAVIAAVIGGCAEPTSQQESLPDEPPWVLPDAVAHAVDDRTTHTLLLPVTPEAPVAGFRVPVPQERAHTMVEGSTLRFHDVLFQLYFDEAPEGAVVFLFDGSTLIGSVLMEPIRGTSWLTAAIPSDVSSEADFGPLRYRAPADNMPGTLGVVVAVRGLTGPAALAIHFDDEYEFEVPSALPTGASVAAAIGTGTAHEVHLRQELIAGIAAPVGLLGAVLEAGAPALEERQPAFVFPHGGARDATMTASCDLGGWGYAATAYLAGEGGGTWSHAVSAGNVTAQDDGIMAWARGHGFLAGALVLGLPVGVAMGDGTEPVEGTVSVQTLETGEIHVALVVALCLDQPMSVLLGVPAGGTATVLDGIVRVERDALDVAGVRITCPSCALPPGPPEA